MAAGPATAEGEVDRTTGRPLPTQARVVVGLAVSPRGVGYHPLLGAVQAVGARAEPVDA